MATAQAASIQVVDVTKRYGQGPDAVMALDAVSLEIRGNEFFTLLGPSGCGKTTLLRMIAGFDEPTTGEIRLDGQPLSGQPPFRRPVNTVFQSYALFPHMTVAENVGFGLKMLNRATDEIAARVDEMLRLVRMEELAHRSTHQLSGGQQQRVALARALAPNPKVLLLDEPLSALDLKLRKAMQIELKRMQQETGITFIFVTHDQEEALTMSDRIAVMNRGRLLQVGTPREIYDHPAERFVADFIGDANMMAAEVVRAEGERGLVRLLSGIELGARFPAGAPRRGSVTVVVRPEHAAVTADRAATQLSGRVTSAVFFGTDMHYHLRLPTGEPFVVRAQNASADSATFVSGDELGIQVADHAVQVLRD